MTRPWTMSALVEEMLDRAAMYHPDAEFTITLSTEAAWELPPTADRVWRHGVGDQLTQVPGFAYQDALIQLDLQPPWLVVVRANPADTTYYGDVRNGRIVAEVDACTQVHPMRGRVRTRDARRDARPSHARTLGRRRVRGEGSRRSH